MVGGIVIDIVKESADRWWVNCGARFELQNPGQCAIFVNPGGEAIDVGDSLWWHGGGAFWTPADRSRVDVRIMKIGYSGVPHPDAPRCPICRCTVGFCRRSGKLCVPVE